MTKSNFIKTTFVLICFFITTWSNGGIGDYKYTDNFPPKKSAPGGVPANKTPLFVCLGFDDNGVSGLDGSGKNGGVKWIYDYLKNKKNPGGNGNPLTHDGAKARATFFVTAKYGKRWVYENYPYVRKSWKMLKDDGHILGNHSIEHLMDTLFNNIDGKKYSQDQWKNIEIMPCHDFLTAEWSENDTTKGMGMRANEIWGWRTPRLEYNNNLFSVMKDIGFVYDCSIEDGGSSDGTSFYFPYTLDNGSPTISSVGNFKGLWEMPAYPFAIPRSLQGKAGGSLLTGLDFNVWAKKSWNGKAMTADDFYEILKFTLDQRLKGNRAPFLVGLHSEIYSDAKTADDFPNAADYKDRQKAIERFIDYALTKDDVRIVPYEAVIKWMRNPVALGTVSIEENNVVQKGSFIVQGNRLVINTNLSGKFRVEAFSLNGKKLVLADRISMKKEGRSVSLSKLSKGIHIISVKNSAGLELLRHKVVR